MALTTHDYCKVTPDSMCNCEHVSHFDDAVDGSPEPRTDHEYCKVPAGNRRAEYAGPVCDHCAETHMSAYLIS